MFRTRRKSPGRFSEMSHLTTRTPIIREVTPTHARDQVAKECLLSFGGGGADTPLHYDDDRGQSTVERMESLAMMQI